MSGQRDQAGFSQTSLLLDEKLISLSYNVPG